MAEFLGTANIHMALLSAATVSEAMVSYREPVSSVTQTASLLRSVSVPPETSVASTASAV